MAERRQRELAFVGGELVGWLLGNLGAAVFAPNKLPKGEKLNPFRITSESVSERLTEHKAKWARLKWRASGAS